MSIEDKVQLQAAITGIDIAVNGDGLDKTQQEFTTDGVGKLDTSTIRKVWNSLTSFNSNNIDSYQIQRRETIVLVTPSEIFNASDIDQNILHVSNPVSGQVITLPELTPDLIDIEFFVITLTQNIVTLVGDGFDAVFGANPVNRDGVWQIRAASTGWFAIFLPFTERNRIHAFENNNALVTTISAVDTWTPINCVLGTSIGETNFVTTGNEIQYIGLSPMYVEYTLSVSGMRGGVTPFYRSVSIGPMVSGGDPTNSVSSTAINQDDIKNVVAVGILAINPLAIIQPGIINNDTDDDVSASEVSLLLKGW